MIRGRRKPYSDIAEWAKDKAVTLNSYVDYEDRVAHIARALDEAHEKALAGASEPEEKGWKMHLLLRHKRTEYMCISKWLESDEYLDMSVNDLVGECMKQANGTLNPLRLKALWIELKAEAGCKFD